MTTDCNPHPVFPAQLTLTGQGLVLREWTDGDLPAMAELFDDPEVAYWTPLAAPFDAAAARAYLQMARRNRADDQRINLAITTDGTQPLGEVLLIRPALDAYSDTSTNIGSIGYSVGSAHRGQRLAVRAVLVMTDYAHHAADMSRVLLQIEAGNEASNAVARGAGYHLTAEPPLVMTSKGRELELRTWAHDRDREG